MIPNVVSIASMLLLWCSSEASGAPTDAPPPVTGGLKIPLRMRSPMSGRSLAERGLLAKRQRDVAIAKYARQPNQKRSEGYNLYVPPFQVVCPFLACVCVRCVRCADGSICTGSSIKTTIQGAWVLRGCVAALLRWGVFELVFADAGE